MDTPRSSPGFRLSFFDIVILVAGPAGAIVLGSQIWWAGMTIGLVVLHSFLLCRDLRISRPPELIWAAASIVLPGLAILTEFKGWTPTPVLTIALSSLLVRRGTEKEDCHGICWTKLNPDFPSWWKAHRQTNDYEQGADKSLHTGAESKAG